ncbi:GntR family transcriptional regulator [Hoeflea alexandrii]
MSAFNRPKSLTELVTENLRDRIVAGDFELGAQLSEARIAKEIEVSRTPVREAINRLEMEGLLVVEPQRGSFVFSLEPNELAKLCDARVCLETAALTYAIQERPQDLAEALEACASRMALAREAGNASEYLALDTLFHQCFFDCAGNRFLNDAYQTIALKMAALRNRLGRHPDHMAKSFREHFELLEAVKERDAQKALEILTAHIDRKEGSYWSDVTGATQGSLPVNHQQP